MIIIGLTGSIGMGKSTVARMLEREGCPIHDADKAVHEFMRPGGAAFESVALAFPDAWDKKKHVIKRDVLAETVFENTEKKELLESILHPLVRADQTNFIKRNIALKRRFCVLEIPLLFETGAEKRVDVTICVSAPFHTQRRRVMARAGMSEELFYSILKAQMPDIRKRVLADFVVQTGLGFAYSHRQVREILRILKCMK